MFRQHRPRCAWATWNGLGQPAFNLEQTLAQFGDLAVFCFKSTVNFFCPYVHARAPTGSRLPVTGMAIKPSGLRVEAGIKLINLCVDLIEPLMDLSLQTLFYVQQQPLQVVHDASII